jgi:DNA-binding NtrC family response regulator
MKPTILIIDDERVLRENSRRIFELEGYNAIAAENGNEGIRKFADSEPDIVLLDVCLPDINGMAVLEGIKKLDANAMVLIITAVPGFDGAVKFIKAGAYDYIPKPFDVEELKFIVQKALESARLKRKIIEIEQEEIRRYGFDKILGESSVIKDVCSLASKAAMSSTTPVMITGESGTGKELLAHAIHLSSPRRDKPFVVVNCTTLSEDLLESDLFGHEKGAFTGAIKKKTGKFEMAHTGTIFLDEMGDLYPKLQMKLLRVLQEHEIERVGGTSPIKVDVRIISATNKDLDSMLKDGSFREDLYYRANVVNIKIPPLRERGEDVLLLSRIFIEEFNREFRKNIKLSPDSERLMLSYQWKGNVRELRNVIERTVLLSDKDTMTAEDLPPEISGDGDKNHSLLNIEKIVPLEKLDEMYIKMVLDRTNGNRSEAARLLGITRQRLSRKIRA